MGRAHASSKLIKASDTPWIILRYIHTSISKNINNRYPLKSINQKLNKHQPSAFHWMNSEFLFLFNVTKWIN